MKNNGSTAGNVSSPKHSYQARNLARVISSEGNHPTATPPTVRQIGIPEKRETLDVLHMQYY